MNVQTTDLNQNREEFLSSPMRNQAVTKLKSLQYENGAWIGEVDLNPGPTSQAVMLFAAVRKEFPVALRSKARRYLIRTQNSDGGWSPHFGAPSEASLTAECYVALRLLGDAENSLECVKARAALLSMGGLPKANPWTQLYMSVLGIVPWKEIHRVPVESLLIPDSFALGIRNFAYWVKVITVPMAILGAIGPGAPIELSTQLRSEMMPSGYDSFAMPGMGAFEKFLRKISTLAASLRMPILRKKAIAKGLIWIDEFTEAHGDFGGNTCTAINVLLVLDRLGQGASQKFTDGLAAFMGYAIEDSDEWRLQTCQSHVWDTGFAMMALPQAMDPESALSQQSGLRWLLENQIREVKGDWSRNVDAKPAGWCFGDRHQHFPVTDCTALALLGLIRHNAAMRSDPRALEGVEWLRQMQHETGGWSAYEKYSGGKWIEKFARFKDIPNALVDVPKADVSAKVVECLSHWRHLPELTVTLSKARKFLLQKRDERGLWRGNYGVNYLYGTAFSAKALHELDSGPSADWAPQVLEFLLAHQNSDGGWGEVEESYRKPELAGTGASSSVQTSWALMALVSSSANDDARALRSLSKGLDYLKFTQAVDGGWTESQFLGTVFPEVVYFRYSLYPIYFPLIASEMCQKWLQPKDRASSSELRFS